MLINEFESYLIWYGGLPLFCVTVSQNEHWVNTQSKGEVGHDVRRWSVEVNPDESAEPQARANGEDHQKDTGYTKARLGPDKVATSEHGHTGICNLQK